MRCLQSSCRKLAFGYARLARSSPITEHRRPESVLVIVYATSGEVLLLKRSAPFEFWQSVTGSLDIGELSADAARRELTEETGLTNEGVLLDQSFSRTFTIDPRWLDRYPPKVTENIEHEWHYRLANVTSIKIDKDEHSEIRWVSLDKAIDSVWSWTNKEALRNLQAQLRHKT